MTAAAFLPPATYVDQAACETASARSCRAIAGHRWQATRILSATTRLGDPRDYKFLSSARWYLCSAPLRWTFRMPRLGAWGMSRAVEKNRMAAAVRSIAAITDYPFQYARHTADVDILVRGKPRVPQGVGWGGTYYVEGTVTKGFVHLDIPDLATLSPRQRGTVMRHELGHALGLAHAKDPHNLMYPTLTVSDWGAGDIAALRSLPAAQQCAPSRNAVSQ